MDKRTAAAALTCDAATQALIGCENKQLFATHQVRTRIMEAERINLIGTQLADLSGRTLDLRGYL